MILQIVILALSVAACAVQATSPPPSPTGQAGTTAPPAHDQPETCAALNPTHDDFDDDSGARPTPPAGSVNTQPAPRECKSLYGLHMRV